MQDQPEAEEAYVDNDRKKMLAEKRESGANSFLLDVLGRAGILGTLHIIGKCSR